MGTRRVGNRRRGTLIRRFALAAAVGATFSLTLPDHVRAATQVPTTTYTQNTTWTLSGSPYVINGDVTVASGATLTIDPGVIVKFKYVFASPRKIIVAPGAVLRAAGTASSKISFTSMKDDSIGGDTGGDGPTNCVMGDGGYVEVQSASPLNLISQAVFRCGPYGQGKTNAPIRVSGTGAALTVSDVDISVLHGSGIYVGGGSLAVARTTIDKPRSIGIMVGAGASATIEETTITGGLPEAGAGHGIRTEDGSVEVSRTTLTNLEFGVVIQLSSTTTAAASTVNDNTITGSKYGVYFATLGTGGYPPMGKVPTGHRNNIYDNVNNGVLNAQQLTAGQPQIEGLDWSNNFWGSTAFWRSNPPPCPDPGYVAYPDATAGSPKSPTRTSLYTAGWPSVYCAKTWAYLGGAGGFAPVPFGSTAEGTSPYLSSGATLGGLDHQFLRAFKAVASDPVATSTGNFAHQEVDLELPGVGLPFRLARTYNSLGEAGGPFGRGWTSNLNAGLRIGNGGDVVVRTEDGAQLPFLRNEDGSFRPDSGIRGDLAATAGGYRLIRPDRRVYEFDGAGLLTRMLDPNGQVLQLAYANGKLSTVTDSAGRLITFSWNASNLLSGVSVPDGRGLSYGYNASGQLASVTDVRGKVWTYEYNPNGQLTRAVSPLGQQLFRNVYDATNGRIIEQYDGLENRTTFAWDAATQTATTTDPLGKQTVDVFAHNLLRTRTDANGLVTTYSYDADGNVASVTDPRSNTTSMTYDARGNMLTRTAPAPLSYVERWTYNAADQPLTYTNGRNKTWTYTYDGNGNLTSETAPGGQITTTYTYHATTGQLLTETDPLGKTTSYGYDSAGNVTSSTDPLGNVTVYGYDAAGRVTSIVDPRGNVPGANPTLYTTAISYDQAGRKLSEANQLGDTTSYTYDDAGRLRMVTNARGKVWTYAYNAANELETVTGPDSAVTARTYTVRGELASETTAAGRKTTYQYDDGGRLTAKVMPRGNVTGANPVDFTWTYGYDAAGNLTGVTDPLGKMTRSSYDALGRVDRATDANGGVTSYAYDAASNLVSITNPLLKTRSFEYDDLNRQTKVTDERGKATTFGYDLAGRLTSVTDPLGKVATSTYDDAGQVASTVDARGNEPGADPNEYRTRYDYDPAGNLTTITNPLGHVSARVYDRAGRLQSLVDPLSRSVGYAYDELGRLTSVRGQDQSLTSYGYDDNTNALTSRTDANLHTATYGYDADGLLTRVTNPLGKTWTFDYDRDGNLVQRVDATANEAQNPALGTTTYSFDRAGRPSGIDYSDTTTDVTYTRDAAGNLTAVTDAAGTKSYGYDAADRLTSVTRGTDTFSYAYDDAGNLTRTTYPGGTVLDYGYDDASRLASLTRGTQTVGYGYDPAGRLTSRTLPNGVAETRGYDRASRLATLSAAKGANTLASYTISRDAAGNPLELASTGGQTETYSYDQFGRITSVCYQAACPNGTDPKIGWTYDSIGNRTTETRAAGATSYTYDAADRLTQTTGPAGTTSSTYDDDGRQTTAGTSSFAWNLADQLTSATVSGSTTTYTSDAAGNRLTATSAGSTTTYLWDENAALPQLALERDATGAVFRRHLHDHAGVLQLTASGSDYWPLLDPYDSVAGLTDASGALARTTSYEPFGAVRSTTALLAGAPASSLGYDSQQLDPLTGLYNLRARQYDPASGRFLATDPIAPAITDPYVSAYVYANNQPTVLSDPTGLCPRDGLLDLGGCLLNEYVDAGKAVWSAVGRAAPAVGKAAWDSTGGALIDLGKNTVKCVDRLIGGESRISTRKCIKTGIELVMSASVGGWLGRSALKAGVKRFGANDVMTTGGRSIPRWRWGSSGVPEGEAKGLPDDALVVRGGSNTEEVFLKRQHELDANGLLRNSSVNSTPGRSVDELSQGIPHSRIGVTTAGDIRAAGGTIVRDPLPGNPFHCLVSGISPATACGLFTPTIPNPSRRP